ncbi:MAG: hypothetical protein LBI86_01825, partial [Treponema sp.]|nr:hypothetical protein [Treponema sp.]
RREKEIKERNRAWKLFLSAIEDDVQPAITEVLEYINRSIDINYLEFEYRWFFAELIIRVQIYDCLKTVKTVNIFEYKTSVTDDVFKNVLKAGDAYNKKAEDLFVKWLRLCWNKAKEGFKKIPEVCYTIHYQNRVRQDIIYLDDSIPHNGTPRMSVITVMLCGTA